ncbi:unnamed protein product [Peronospora belbahrii]|nr:unnamed protein product [Peronospora belbahrii]
MTQALEQTNGIKVDRDATKAGTVPRMNFTTGPGLTARNRLWNDKDDDNAASDNNCSSQKEKTAWIRAMPRDLNPMGFELESVQKILEKHDCDSMESQDEQNKTAVELVKEKLTVEKDKVMDDVVRVNLDELPDTPCLSSNSKSLSKCASVYSSSSIATVSSSSSLFGDTDELVLKPQHSWTSPKSVSIVKRRPSLERQNSSPTEEVFARSAGFLRKSNRTMSARLSVSDLGLLCNDDDVDSGNLTPEATLLDDVHSRQKNLRSSQGHVDGLADDEGPTVSAKVQSQRDLFADVDKALKAKAKQKNSDTDLVDGDTADADSFTYGEFLQRISQRASRDILDKMRMFVGSILGPRGDGRPPRSTDYIGYDFYGTHELRRRCNHFFESMGDMLLNHPAWRHASDSKLAKARDGIEKYVMDKVSDIAFNRLKECRHWVKEDEALVRRMQLLSFITPAMLDIKPCMRNEVVWSMAEDELRRINSFRSPGDKINCIVRCCGVIFSVLNLSRGESGSRPGADDFLPVFIYIVLHSQIPRLYSNCEYISAYRNQADLMSKAGYCFVNLRSALEFIMVMDGSMLSISDDEFQRLYFEREKNLL